MKTWDTIARIELCINYVLSEYEPITNYNVMEKMKKEFPDENFKDGDVLDAWGCPIRLDIKHSGAKTTVSIKSACRGDGIFNESSIESVINISISEPYISTAKCEAQGNKSTDRGQP
jgi:hypothetical protein